MAGRATFGLGRAGGFGANASGEYALAFSTAQHIPHREDSDHLELRFLRDDSAALRELFEAAAEVVHEAVLNALCVAEPMEGRDGNRVEALPYELLALRAVRHALGRRERERVLAAGVRADAARPAQAERGAGRQAAQLAVGQGCVGAQHDHDRSA